MAESRFVYVTYIRATPQAVWDELTNPERNKLFWSGYHQETSWKVGDDYEVVGPDGRVQIRNVTLGRLIDHSYVVEAGLARGDKVIIEGLQNVQPGAKPTVQEETPPAQASAEPRGG